MTIDEISVAVFKQMHNASLCVIDVREVDEYEAGHVKGAINMPLSEFAARLLEVPKEKTVYMICRSGGRSMQACEFCHDAGVTNVKNVAGGTMGWIAAGNEVVMSASPE